jgi:hypothetical protein
MLLYCYTIDRFELNSVPNASKHKVRVDFAIIKGFGRLSIDSFPGVTARKGLDELAYGLVLTSFCILPPSKYSSGREKSTLSPPYALPIAVGLLYGG